MVERAIVRKLSLALSNAFTRGHAQTDRLDIAGFSAVLEDVQTKVINRSQCVEMAVEAAKRRCVMLWKIGDYLLEQLIGEIGEGCRGRGCLCRLVMAI